MRQEAGVTTPCPPRATVYCGECGNNRQVMRVVEQRRYPTGKGPRTNGLRYVRGKAICGHGFNVVVTLETLAVMREGMG